MKKKTLLLTLTAACAGLGITAVALSSASAFNLTAGGGYQRNYSVQFELQDIAKGTYDSKSDIRYFSLFHSNAIDLDDGNKYDIETFSYDSTLNIGTFFHGPDITSYNTKGHFIQFSSWLEWDLHIAFKLVNRATLDSDSSFSYSVGGSYGGECHFTLASSDELYSYYEAKLTVDDLGGAEAAEGYEVTVDTIVLKFSCPH